MSTLNTRVLAASAEYARASIDFDETMKAVDEDLIHRYLVPSEINEVAELFATAIDAWQTLALIKN